MRFKVALVFVMTWLTHAHVYAQKQPPLVSFSMEHVTLDEVLAKLKKASSPITTCIITYDALNTGFHDVSVEIEDATVEEALEICLHDFPLWYHSNVSHDTTFFELYRTPSTRLRGRVLWDEHEALENLSVCVVGTSAGATTDKKGYFTLYDLGDSAQLEISGVNIQTKIVRPEGRKYMDIRVQKKEENLSATTITPEDYDAGYGPHATIPPGAHDHLDRRTIEKAFGLDPFSVLSGQASGVQLPTGTNNPSQVTIRGVSTLNGEKGPLLIWDGFPYPGDPRSININDVGDMYILKDAMAALPWAARGGNGGIVINTMSPSKGLHVTFSANLTLTPKGIGSRIPIIDPKSNMALDKYFYDQGFYDGALSNASHPAVPPVVEALDLLHRQQITTDEYNSRIAVYSGQDLRKDYDEYYSRSSVRQQYHLAISSGNSCTQYYLSGGYDNDPTSLVRNGLERYTVHASLNQGFLPQNRLQLRTLVNFASIGTKDNNSGALPANYSYAGLADPAGNPLAVNNKYSTVYTDTAGDHQLRDWRFRPLQELRLADNATRIIDCHAQVALQYTIKPGFTVEGTWRLMKERQTVTDRYNKDGFFVRDLTNRFTQRDAGGLSSLIPPGDILDRTFTTITAQNWRGQVQYADTTGDEKDLKWNAEAGIDQSETSFHNETSRLFGYDPDHSKNELVDLKNSYPDYMTGAMLPIPGNQAFQDLYTRYLSFYVNAALTWKQKYTVYGTVKQDGTNIIGVKASRQSSPFWALGVSYDAGAIQMRASYGCTGNVGNRTGRLTTQRVGNNSYGDPQSGIANPPDPFRRWEKDYTLNLGVDHGWLKDKKSPEGRLRGSLDIFGKRAVGLLATDTLPMSSGFPAFFSNSATIKGHGIDLVLHADLIRRDVRWSASLLLSYVRDKVTKYAYTPASIAGYVMNNSPMQGKPVTALFSYRNTTLDPINGDPRGYLHDTVSKSYGKMVNIRPDSAGNTLVYSGNYQPALYGGLTNTVSWKRWSLFALIDIKACYVIRRPSINYYRMINGLEPGMADYSQSWRQPGDEQRTYVPSPPRSVNDPDRSNFYAYSQATITRGDCIRLRDLRLSYDLLHDTARKAFSRKITLYFNIHQVCILYRANPYGIDPEAFNYGDLPIPRSYTLGIRMEL